MQRRRFTQTTLGLAALSAAGWSLPTLARAQIGGFREGSDYRRLARPAPVDAPAGKIEVVEFFAYTCIHCHNFVPVFKEWVKTLGPDVVVRRNPVGFNAAFEPLQRLYYTLEAMGKLDSHHERVFKAIHEDKQRLHNPDAIAQWAERNGLDKAQFTQTYNSFAVVGKVRRATQMQDAYEVEGTPALGIAGRFYIPGQAARTVQVANALIAEARKG